MKKLLLYLFICCLGSLSQLHGQVYRTVYVDFGPNDNTNGNITPSPDVNGSYWNNATDPNTTATPLNLVDTKNLPTGATLVITTTLQKNGIQNGGLLNPSSTLLKQFAIANATQDYFHTATSGSITIKGLNKTRGYTFSLFATRNDPETRITTYTIQGAGQYSATLKTSGTNLGGTGYNGNNSTVLVTKTMMPNSNGEILLTITKTAGAFAYLGALKMEEVNGVVTEPFCKTKDPYKIAWMGSSVAYGVGSSTGNQGYVYRYAQELKDRSSGGRGKNWNVSNISISGNNTIAVLNRWNSDLLPQCSKYVVYGLGLGNEGIITGGQQALDQFQSNLLLLINKSRLEGIEPIIANCYVRNDFTATQYNYVKQMNALINSWNVASINLLGAVDDGAGHWVNGYWYDALHPNDAGHSEFMLSIVPSLFDALDAGKQQPKFTTSTSLPMSSTSDFKLQFTPEEIVHPFTISFDVKTSATGSLCQFETSNGINNLTIAPGTGKVLYTSSSSTGISGATTVTNNQWHKVTLTHYYALGKTLLYVDNVLQGTVNEKILAKRFTIAGETSPAAEYRNLLFYRSAINGAEVGLLNSSQLLKSSLEIYSPLDATNVDPLINLAQSLNKVVKIRLNKYQVYGELLLDKIHAKFYNSSNQLYVETIDGNERIINPGPGTASYAWPASHMLRALQYGAIENPNKYQNILKNYAYNIDKYKHNGKYGSSINPNSTPFYDDNAILGTALMDIYQKVMPNDVSIMNRSLVGLFYCLNARDNNWGVPQLESQLGKGAFYSQATILPALHCAMMAKTSTDPNYLNIAKGYYGVINDVNRKLRDANTNLIHQSSYYYNGTWALTTPLDASLRGGGFRGYQTTPDVQLALKLYQLTNDVYYLNDAYVMANAALAHWLVPGKGLSEISFWGGNDMVDMLIDLYELDHNPKWLNAARDIVDFLIAHGRDKLGYYASSENDADGQWKVDRTGIQPTSISIMGQACAAAAMLRLAYYENTNVGIPAGIYTISNQFSGKLLGIKGGSNSTNAPATTFDNNQSTYQRWKISVTPDGYYTITNINSGQALDITDCGTANGTLIQQYTQGTGNDCQKFSIVDVGGGYFKIVAKTSSKCIDGGVSNVNDTQAYLWDQADVSNQKWSFDPVTSGNGDGLSGNYFNGMNFEILRYSGKDATINKDWGSGSPNTLVNADQFSVRWTGQVQPKYSGEYTFYLNSDNGRRLWVNGQLLIDNWADNWGTEYSGKITLVAQNKYDIKVEYFENVGAANILLSWSSASQTKEVIPTSQLYSNTLPTVSISSNNTSAKAPAQFVFTAIANDANGISKVDFYNGTTLIGTTTSAPYRFTWTNVSPGTYNISALAIDAKSGVTLSSIITVDVNTTSNNSPTISLTSPTNNSSMNAPATLSINANASDSDGTISKVEFYSGITLLGSDATSPYSYVWTNVAAGTYLITAKATDNTGATTTSSAISVSVKAIATDVCANTAQYIENGGYVAGSKVKNVGKQYQCKEFPYSGWCNGAAWAYGPGTGSYWTDAWYEKGNCAARTGNDAMVSDMDLLTIPNPVINTLNLHSSQDLTGGKIKILNSLGVEILTVESYSSSIDVSSLSSGVYIIMWSKDNNSITKNFVK